MIQKCTLLDDKAQNETLKSLNQTHPQDLFGLAQACLRRLAVRANNPEAQQAIAMMNELFGLVSLNENFNDDLDFVNERISESLKEDSRGR